MFCTHLGLTSHLNMDDPEMHISENHSEGDAPVTWDSLDDSALIEIFRRLGAGSLAALQLVDSRCRRLASEDICWRQVYGHTSNPAAIPSQPLNPPDPLCSLVLYADTPSTSHSHSNTASIRKRATKWWPGDRSTLRAVVWRRGGVKEGSLGPAISCERTLG